jgi:protein-S-isoprenylcysteine O-methyltransferase Ste14
MTTFLRYYLPLYLLIYLAIAFVVPTYRTWKRTGINPVTFGKSDTAHDYIGFLMKSITILLVVVVGCFAAGEALYIYLSPIGYLQGAALRITGLVLIHLALVWIAIAQYQMGTSWRIGIDEAHTTVLRTKGLFSISRNPIFAGMLVSIAGLFLILPNALMLSLTVLSYGCIQVQIRLEEVFLQQQHGEAYQNYRAATRRLF